MISVKVIAPENKRMAVKLAGSMLVAPNAIRHKTELAAKAISAKQVVVLIRASCGQPIFVIFLGGLLCIGDVCSTVIQ